jgi:CHAD domain-containing protein
MITEFLIVYFDDQSRKMLENWNLATGRNDPDGIHDYRVCIKRIKALFHLVKSIDPDFRAKKHFRRFRDMFKSAAALRDIHIHAGIAREFSGIEDFPSAEYSVFLLKEECAASKKFTSFYKDFDISRLQKSRRALERALAGADPDREKKRARSRVLSLLEDLTARVENPKRAEKDMHSIRMIAKELHYTSEMLGVILEAPYGTNRFIGEIKNMHQALGSWHDYDLAPVYLDRFTEKGGYIPPHAADAVCGKIEGEKKKLVEAFETAWTEFKEILNSSGSVT